MVEPEETKVKTEGIEEKKVFKFKKKNQRNNNLSKNADQAVPELLKGVEFFMGRNGLEFYLTALEKLQLYASTTYKNGADVRKCLKLEKLITFTAPELDENATATQKEMWKIPANNTIKREELMEANLEAMYEVVMSICEPVMKDQICNHEGCEEIDNMQDKLGLLKIIKKTMYSNGEDDMHLGYNHVIAITNY